MNYRKIWEKHNNKKIPEGYEIHHIDGNRNNNDPNNLMCVSIEEHIEIHKKQEEWGAVHAILIRIIDKVDKKDISEAASKAQKQRWNEGKHNFQNEEVQKRRKKACEETMRKRIEEHGVAFLNIKNTKENSRRAGLKSAEKKAGFLNTQSENMVVNM